MDWASFKTKLQPYRIPVYCLIITLFAYLLADISNFVIMQRLEKLLSVPKRSAWDHTGKPIATVSAFDSQSIIRRNLFDPNMGVVVKAVYTPVIIPKPVLPPEPPPVVALPPPPPPPVIPKPPLQVMLIGTVISKEIAPYAVIEDKRTRRQLLYRVGDFLTEDAKVTRIERNRVVVTRDDEEIILEPSSAPVTAPRAQPVAIPPTHSEVPENDRIRQIGRTAWALDRIEVDQAVTNLPELMTKARVVPNFTEGKPDGFRIFAIREGSLYEKLGLQNGDILKRVNNIDVRDPQNLLHVFEQLKHASNITVDLVRADREETFSYAIR